MNTSDTDNMGASSSIRMSLVTSLTLLVVAGVFAYAGISKISNVTGFAREIEYYRIVSRSIAVVTALYLPWIEVGCAVAIFVRRLRGGALLILAACSVVFVFFITSALVRGLDISCGCFGAEDAATGRIPLFISLARAVLLAVASMWLLRRHIVQTARITQL